jgi:hypothetical protein
MTGEDPFDRLEARRMDRDRERMDLHKRIAQLNTEAEKDSIALQVLKEMYPDGWKAAQERSPKPDGALPSPIAKAATMLFKDVILAILRDAAPGGLTANQIKAKAMLKYKVEINPNTLTVTLGRFSRPPDGSAPKAKYDGDVWRYLPTASLTNLKPAELPLNGGRAA